MKIYNLIIARRRKADGRGEKRLFQQAEGRLE